MTDRILTPCQRRDLRRVQRSSDPEAIAAVINQVLANNPTASLGEIERVFRAATTTAFVIASEPFKVVIGFRAWRAALAEAGMTAEQNRQALAGRTARQGSAS